MLSVGRLACLIRSEGFTLGRGKTWSLYKKEVTRDNKSKEARDLRRSPAVPTQGFSNFHRLNPKRGTTKLLGPPQYPDWVKTA